MTIALGIMADDGIVVAADTQESTGDLLKGDKHKIMSFGSGDRASQSLEGGCVVAGAGDSGHTKALIEEIGFAFMANGSLEVMGFQDDKKEFLKGKFRSCLQYFYKQHIIPFAAFPSRDRPDVEVLIAFYRRYMPYMFYTEKTAITHAGRYKAIGMGSTYAELLLNKFWKPKMSVTEAELLAAYVVFMTKESVEHCGKYTSMLTLEGEKFSPGGEAIQSDGIRYTPWQTIASWEHLFRTTWNEAERSLMHRQIEDEANRIKPRKIRSESEERERRLKIVEANFMGRKKNKKKSPG